MYKQNYLPQRIPINEQKFTVPKLKQNSIKSESTSRISSRQRGVKVCNQPGHVAEITCTHCGRLPEDNALAQIRKSRLQVDRRYSGKENIAQARIRARSERTTPPGLQDIIYMRPALRLGREFGESIGITTQVTICYNIQVKCLFTVVLHFTTLP